MSQILVVVVSISSNVNMLSILVLWQMVEISPCGSSMSRTLEFLTFSSATVFLTPVVCIVMANNVLFNVSLRFRFL